MKIYNTAFRDSQSAVLFIIIQMWLATSDLNTMSA